MSVEVNYLAVFLAAIGAMVVGAVWYSPGVMGNSWMKLTHVKMNRRPPAGQMLKLYGVSFVLSFLTALILAHVSFLSNNFFHHNFLQDSVVTALWLWIGLTAARIVLHDMFEGRRKKLTLLTVSHELVTLLVMGVIIGLLKP